MRHLKFLKPSSPDAAFDSILKLPKRKAGRAMDGPFLELKHSDSGIDMQQTTMRRKIQLNLSLEARAVE
jgi:hypothetical protein